MKGVLCWIFLCISLAASSQIKLELASNKTTSLIFPFPILHVDRGSLEVLVLQVKDAKNILLVKAGSCALGETNLSVITGDGSLYAFRVSYQAEPLQWVYHLPVLNRTSVEMDAAMLLDNAPLSRRLKWERYGITLQVSGIYIRGPVMYWQLRLTNESPIGYDVGSLRFYLRDKKVAKRTAVQEVELAPVYTCGKLEAVAPHTEAVMIICLNKLTIPDAKELVLELREKDGGRDGTLKIKNRHLLRALPLPTRP
jgi:conjugative transposon TraN protein